MDISIDSLIHVVNSYDKGAEEMVRKAYECAFDLHKGQFRQSGEPYIIHPLHVAYILAELHADRNTICAALLHDTIEDTTATYEEIKSNFNEDVANLVDGVTKISRMNFSSKSEQNLANTRKIITGITNDVRIIIIKLSDRLHNMRTLQYKSEFKQKENSLETLKIFAPLAYYIGAYGIKEELEDISLQYLDYSEYQKIYDKVVDMKEKNTLFLRDMLEGIHKTLNCKDISNDVLLKIKNIYGIYKQLCSGYHFNTIHDLISYRVLVNEVEDCYLSLMHLHQRYKPVNEFFRDYICNPKCNFYQSLHTTVFSDYGHLIQLQIRTHEMDKIASYGLARYWEVNGEEARIMMQSDLKSKYQFYSSLNEIDHVFNNDGDFLKRVELELFGDMVYVFTTKGDIIELPLGSTPVDFAFRLSSDIGMSMVGAMVNDEYVPYDYVLKSGERVKILTGSLVKINREKYEKAAFTTHAKRKIRECFANG